MLTTAAIDRAGVRIVWQDHGSAEAGAILLIMGIGAPATRWPEVLIDGLGATGLRVLTFDHRDCGLSQQLAGTPDFRAIARAVAAGQPPPVSYSIADLADDAAAVLDAAGVAAATVVGVSMGGAVAQTLALHRPERVRSLVSIMSTTGAADLPGSSGRVRALVAGVRDEDDPPGRVATLLRSAEAGRSPGFPVDAATIRARAEAEVARGFTIAGRLRQAAALAAAPDRSGALARLAVPTTVIHGEDDELFPIAHGEATARAIPGARLVRVPGLGHDLPDGAMPVVLEAIRDVVANAHSAG